MDKEKYKKFALVREMLEVPGLIRNFQAPDFSLTNSKLLITGEGSSRIFPGKNARYLSLVYNLPVCVEVEGALQSIDYDLDEYTVFMGSNSGKTAEGVVFSQNFLSKNKKIDLLVTAQQDTMLSQFSKQTHVLSCGKEQAVAATKSVIEQALVYESIIRKNFGLPVLDYLKSADKMEEILMADVPAEILSIMTSKDFYYWSGRNTGVAEELALKTVEITRTKSHYLEGTLLVHGVEEAMKDNELVFLLDTFMSQFEKINETVQKTSNVPCVILNTQNSPFKSFSPLDGDIDPNFKNYLNLASGWRLLVEIGISEGVNLDLPVRARKIGNEFNA